MGDCKLWEYMYIIHVLTESNSHKCKNAICTTFHNILPENETSEQINVDKNVHVLMKNYAYYLS